MAFPVFKAVPGTGQNDTHHIFAWKVVQDLQLKVAQFGINSSEVMQLIHVINAVCLHLMTSCILLQFYSNQYNMVCFKKLGGEWRSAQL